MRVAFLITSLYQVHHYKWIAPHLPEVHAVIEMRDRAYGLSEELVERHLAPAGIHWVSRERLSTLDGRFDAIVCHTPVLPLEFLTSTYVVAQQYSLAKERYQYGVWRAHAHLNLMYGDYSVRKVGGFSNAVAVGNPLLDPCLRQPVAPRRGLGAPGRRPRLLYLPTHGGLSSMRSVLPRLRGIDAEVTVKPHHAGDRPAGVEGVRVVDPDTDPAELLAGHDGVISDFSGAVYDALYAGLPVVLAGSADPRGRDYSRLSPPECDRSLLDGLAATWHPDGDLLEAFAAAERLLDGTAYKEFLAARFVNPGSAGAACGSEILRLLAEGEPDHFGAQQVRDATRRYILSLRSRTSESRHGVPTSRRLARTVSRHAPVDLRLAYRRCRRFLARSAAVHRLVRGVRRQVRSRSRGPAPGFDDPPPATPGGRREGVFTLLAPYLEAERVPAARDCAEPGADLAVPVSARRGLHRALRRLAGAHPELRVRLGTDARVVDTLPVCRLAYRDLVDAQWLEVGGDRERGGLRIGTAGYLTVLFVEHDRAKNRYLALRKRAGRADWTTLFGGRQPGGAVAVGTRPPHAAAPVDAVYTWVDSGDPAWREAYQRYSEWCDAHNVSANNPERYVDREELRYSLRALWTFAPFVRHIYLVTADQVPWWLAKDHPRVTVVPHREIFPDPSVLPTFNSHAIESCLHRIPGLSEHILYLNDDVFLGREVGERDFFTHAGLAKVRLSPSQYIYQGEPEPSAIPTDWAAYNSLRLMRRDFALSFDRRVQHVPLPLRRSVMQEIEQRYPAEVERTRAARFRAVTDLAVPSMLAQFYGIATARAVEWPPTRNEYLYLDTGRRDSVERFERILRKQPTFFCLNVTRHTEVPLAEQARHLHEFLSAALPVPAPWEVDRPAG
jgi:hypothetical protein